MSTLAISVEDLGKRYLIGEAHAVNDSFRDAVSAAVGRQLRKFRTKRRSDEDVRVLWALRGANFEVRHGEVVGIVGRNGAGKSTLLKILSRVTQPSEGRATIRGRVGSLLEVGTGFHEELTGRQNIYLNGAILGMDRAYINSRFDEIVAFAEIERFIDTPVKRYSSGMRLRLGFAVAAHLEAEVMIVDEVLAVGDAQFQRKCIGKMGEVTKEGRTVLFVSHNMAAVQGLCTRAILLEQGAVTADGTTSEIIDHYMKGLSGTVDDSVADLFRHGNRSTNSPAVFRRAQISSGGVATSVIRMGQSFEVETWLESEVPIKQPHFTVAVEDAIGQRLFLLSPYFHRPDLLPDTLTKAMLRCEVPALPLTPGSYYLTFHLANSSDRSTAIDRIPQAIQFTVELADVFDTGFAPGQNQGVLFTPAHWTMPE